MNIFDIGLSSAVAIVVICYLVGYGLKAWDKFDDRKIPVIMGVVGAALGAAAFYIAPNVVMAEDPLTAIAIGILSGLSATAINQIYKQAKKED